ncbi:AraC family transcriptional regulator [Stomatohabitans albus]|uniref:AraC family transcriptional regulator n=1 Tax=Stomatohabitans albus TaxID=3110766 RepID=UPI00300CA7D6
MAGMTEWVGPIPGTTLWRVTGGDQQHLVLPDAAMDLVISGNKIIFAGPDTQASLVSTQPGQVTWGLRFAPGMAHQMLGLPVCELQNERVALSELVELPMSVQEVAIHNPVLALKCSGTSLWRQCLASPTDIGLAHAIDHAARRGIRVKDLAEMQGLSTRTLQRICNRVFGYGPKTLVAIHQLNRAIGYGCKGIEPALVAVAAGYADQSHLIRSTQQLTGMTFNTLIKYRTAI